MAHVYHHKGYKPTTLHLLKSVLCREHVDDANEPGSYVFRTFSMSIRPHNRITMMLIINPWDHLRAWPTLAKCGYDFNPDA